MSKRQLQVRKFVAFWDTHYGYERDAWRNKKALHDSKAINILKKFIKDFEPDTIIMGGDGLDCGAISHHNRSKPGRTEGLRVMQDAREFRAEVLEPLEKTKSDLVYIIGNHEDWLNDLVDRDPGLEGLVEPEVLLGLDNGRWTVIPQGKHFNLGKLTFVHGDQLRGGEHVAKAAVIAYERSVRFGHFHTHQVYTKTSAIDIVLGRTGKAVPCLCTKEPKYGEGAPNRWVQGFNYGYVLADGTYSDYIVEVVNGRTIVNGRVYIG